MRFIILYLFVFVSFCAFSQDIRIVEGIEKIHGTRLNSFSVYIDHPSKSTVTKEWKKKLKTYGAKISTRKDIFADNAVVPTISIDTVDIYSKVKKHGKGQRLSVSFAVGNIGILNSRYYDEQSYAAEEFIYDFAVRLTKMAIEDELEKSESEEKQLQADFERLEKQHKKYNDAIERYERLIIKTKDNIRENEQEKENKKKEIEVQKTRTLSIRKRLLEVK